ncbi:hypothetical protein BHE74_00048663, partial [Ensete ventricosum]
ARPPSCAAIAYAWCNRRHASPRPTRGATVIVCEMSQPPSAVSVQYAAFVVHAYCVWCYLHVTSSVQLTPTTISGDVIAMLSKPL